MMNVYPYVHPPAIPVMKKELAYTGPFGLFAYLASCLFIDRCNSDDAKKKLNESVIHIKKKGVNKKKTIDGVEKRDNFSIRPINLANIAFPNDY